MEEQRSLDSCHVYLEFAFKVSEISHNFIHEYVLTIWNKQSHFKMRAVGSKKAGKNQNQTKLSLNSIRET